MRNAQGYATLVSPDGVKEADTYQCAHCQYITHVKAGQSTDELGGVCTHCTTKTRPGFICKRCVGKPCDPFEKKLEREEARYHALRSYGHA